MRCSVKRTEAQLRCFESTSLTGKLSNYIIPFFIHKLPDEILLEGNKLVSAQVWCYSEVPKNHHHRFVRKYFLNCLGRDFKSNTAFICLFTWLPFRARNLEVTQKSADPFLNKVFDHPFNGEAFLQDNTPIMAQL